MKIKSLKMENFRQFYGTNELVFSEDNQQNITIILGKNGNGKTGIFRAILFAMYAIKRLEQDPDDAIELVNKTKIQENKDRPTIAMVELAFEHQGEDYVIKRQLIHDPERNLQVYESEVILNHRGQSGDWEQVEPSEINHQMNKILDSSISEFFFFDAEKMQILNNSKRKVKGNGTDIKRSIQRLLQIEDLETANQLIATAYNEVHKESQTQSNDEQLNRLINHLQELEESKEKANELINRSRAEMKQIKEEMAGNQAKVENNIELAGKTEKYELAKRHLASEKEHLEEAKDNLKPLFTLMGDLLAQPILNRQDSHFTKLLEQRDDNIPIDLLIQSIEAHECVLCHQSLNETKEDMIRNMMEQRKFDQLTEIIRKIPEKSHMIEASFEDKKERVAKQLKSVAMTNQKVLVAEEEVEKTQSEIGDNPTVDPKYINQLKKQNQELEQKLAQIENNISEQKIRINNFENEIEKTQRNINSFQSNERDIQKKVKMSERLYQLKKLTSEVLTSYKEESIHSLSKVMTNNFRQLISEKDLDTFSEVKITNNFDIQLLDRYGYDVTANSSMGQGQILTLAFITSIAQFASRGRDEMVFPLLMDTPFGRLDKENRANLIRLIPDLAQQWILLLTDTELSETEQALFNKYGRVGRVYELVNRDSKTQIVAKNNINELNVKGEY